MYKEGTTGFSWLGIFLFVIGGWFILNGYLTIEKEHKREENIKEFEWVQKRKEFLEWTKKKGLISSQTKKAFEQSLQDEVNKKVKVYFQKRKK